MDKERTNLTTDDIAQEFENYKRFAFKDDMFRLAIAFVLGGAFGKVVSSISDDLIMPFMAFLTSFTGDSWKTMTWTPIEGLTLAIGKFAGTMLEFFLVSVALYIVVKVANRILESKNVDDRDAAGVERSGSDHQKTDVNH